MFASNDMILSLNQIPPLPSSLPSISQHLNLEVFKVYPCQKNDVHDQNVCPFFHLPSDKRRTPCFYAAVFCDQATTCALKEECPKCHNKTEFLYHPNNYKMMFCKAFWEKETCNLGTFCPFAHLENELQGETLHDMRRDADFYIFYYKTVFCPFIWKEHNGMSCVYAHSLQELRRKPHIFEYGVKECQNFLNNNCPNGRRCKDSHGKMEIEFHPLSYKTIPCKNKGCQGAENCPYAHLRHEIRPISNEIKSNVFIFRPTNRKSCSYPLTNPKKAHYHSSTDLFTEIKQIKATKSFCTINDRQTLSNKTSKEAFLSNNNFPYEKSNFYESHSHNVLMNSNSPERLNKKSHSSGCFFRKKLLDSIPYFESSLNDMFGSLTMTCSTSTNSSVLPENKKYQMVNKIDEEIDYKVRKEQENENNQPEEFKETFKNILRNICEEDDDE